MELYCLARSRPSTRRSYGVLPGKIYLPTVSLEGLWGASRGDMVANCLPRGVMGCFPGGYTCQLSP